MPLSSSSKRRTSCSQASAAYAVIGVIQAAHGPKPDAEKAFRAAVAVDPKNVGAHLALANYLMSVGGGWRMPRRH